MKRRLSSRFFIASNFCNEPLRPWAASTPQAYVSKLCAMVIPSTHRCLREFLAILAIFAMLLGPLATAVSRGLSAQERVNVAAGLVALPICVTADNTDGLGSTSTFNCDHCLPAIGSAKLTVASLENPWRFAALIQPDRRDPSALLTQLQLPPATGPPTLI
jgi:hypothetical protein